MAEIETSAELLAPPLPPSWIGLLLAGGAAGLQVATAPDQTVWAGMLAAGLAVFGLIIGGYGVSLRPRNLLVLLVAAGTSALASYGFRTSWDAIWIMPWVMTGVALAAAAIVVLPRSLQRIAVCGLVIFHFVGVLTAITSPFPQSWLTNKLWVHVFRPHLLFCYTNNAYQFYSPEPGPASLLWFCVEMKDGQKIWYKMPRKPETHLDPLGVEFFRRLSMSEASNQTYNLGPTPMVLENRKRVYDIPLHPTVNLQNQYRPLQEYARRIVASYVQHLASRMDQNLETNPDSDQIKSIKVYRVLHDMMKQKNFALQQDPFDKATYYPYYLGEYDAKGELKDHSDPMLYWVIPIVKRRQALIIQPNQESAVDNYLEIHAGTDPFKE